jgi:hypothetical protein
MIETHDLFLRALAVPVAKKEKKKKKKPADTEEDESYAADEPTWPEYVIAFDTESRVALGQSLTFGVYRLSRLVGQSYEAIEEGVFYGDNLPAKDLNVLKTYMETAVSDVPSFPPRFPLYSRSEFMEKVFWHALKKWGATIVGFNLPYDLSRLALAWKEGSKGEWSLIMEQYADGKGTSTRSGIACHRAATFPRQCGR